MLNIFLELQNMVFPKQINGEKLRIFFHKIFVRYNTG